MTQTLLMNCRLQRISLYRIERRLTSSAAHSRHVGLAPFSSRARAVDTLISFATKPHAFKGQSYEPGIRLSPGSRLASTIASAAASPSADGTDADEIDAKAESSKSVLRKQVEHITRPTKEDVTPLSRYDSLIARGLLRDDPHQRRIIGILQEMHNQLKDYDPPPVPDSSMENGGFFSRIFGSSSKPHPKDIDRSVPLGLYLYGSVGTGKTMLMDLFYETLPPPPPPPKDAPDIPIGHYTRKRIHFHAFMLDIFRRVHEIRHGLPRGGGKKNSDSDKTIHEVGTQAAQLTGERRAEAKARAQDGMEGRSATGAIGVEALSGGGLFKGLFGGKKAGGQMVDEEDAIYEVAREMAREGRVLCFDEFQVTDIVTAMLLRQLLERMMSYGVVCIMTSNRHPDELYMNGIQRGSFLPCIELIKERFRVVDLNTATDYRRVPKALSKVYFSPLNDATKAEMRRLFDGFTEFEDDFEQNRKLRVFGRTVRVPQCTKNVAKFTFEELCGHPLSSADYLEITKNFGTIFIEDVPRMTLSQKDLARRFITFIDACYENRSRLFISSEVSIYSIFSDDPAGGGKSAAEVNDHMRHVMDDLGLAAGDVQASSLFSGQEETFAFGRCVSRLVQMGTKEWTSSTHHAPIE